MNIVNRHGVAFGFEATKLLMDSELYKELLQKMPNCTEQEMFDAYCEAHKEKYGKLWTFDDSNPMS